MVLLRDDDIGNLGLQRWSCCLTEMYFAENSTTVYPPKNVQVPTDTVTDAVRGQLHGKRLLLVRAAFSRLERSGKGNSMGEAVASDVAKAFNSAAHPEVMAGRRDAEVRMACSAVSSANAAWGHPNGRERAVERTTLGNGVPSPKSSFGHVPQPEIVRRESDEAKTVQSESCTFLRPI